MVTCSSPATTRRSNTSSILGLAKLASPFMGIPVHFPPELNTFETVDVNLRVIGLVPTVLEIHLSK